jgi:hypothetical protein
MDRVAVEAERPKVNDAVAGGLAAGVLAGAAMIVWAVASAALADLAPTRWMEVAGATLTGGDAGDEGPHFLLAGALLWLAVSAALGLLFAAMIPRDYPFVSAAILGVGYSFGVLAIMASSVLPRVNPALRAEMTQTGGAWVLAYVAFGLVLGVVPALRQRFARAARR